MNLDDLKKPFAPEKISWRVGSTTKDKSKGMALCYIDARDVQDRLDEVCGIAGWQCRYVPMHDKKTVCEIGICVSPLQMIAGEQGLGVKDFIPACWVWKADGAGDSDVEAEKGALSDAFKRAAVKWGIGRYLYDLDSPWVELDTYEKNGQVFAKGIKPSEFAKLRALLAGNAPKAAPAPAPTAKPKRTAAEWVEQAAQEILACRTKVAFTAWLQTNSAAIDKLHSADKALYNTINQKIALRNDELEKAA